MKWTLSIDVRGYRHGISALVDVNKLLLQQRIGPESTINISWPRNPIDRQPVLQAKSISKYNY